MKNIYPSLNTSELTDGINALSHAPGLALILLGHTEPFPDPDRRVIFPFCHYELKGFDNPPKDGRPQAYTAMSSALCLYAYIKDLPKNRDKEAFEQWEAEASDSEISMMERCYGIVAHEATWTIYMMVLDFRFGGKSLFS